MAWDPCAPAKALNSLGDLAYNTVYNLATSRGVILIAAAMLIVGLIMAIFGKGGTLIKRAGLALVGLIIIGTGAITVLINGMGGSC